MTDTRAERPPLSPGGDPAGGFTAPIIANEAPGLPRAAFSPRLTLLHGSGPTARGGHGAGRKPDLRVVWAAATGEPAVVHSTRPGTSAAQGAGAPPDGRQPAGRSGDIRAEGAGHLRLVGRRDVGRGSVATLPLARGSLERLADVPLAALPGMRDDASGADALSGGKLTLASLRETLEMERPL